MSFFLSVCDSLEAREWAIISWHMIKEMVLTTRGETHFRKQGLTPKMGKTSMDDGRIQNYFSYSYLSFSTYCSLGTGLSTRKYFSFSVVLTQDTQPCMQCTGLTFQFLSSVSTRNHETHHHFISNRVITISSNFFNQCQQWPAPRTFFKEIQSRKCSVSYKMPFPPNLTLWYTEIIFGQPFKKCNLWDRSSREIFHRIKKLFPIQTCSIPYIIREDRWSEYSGKWRKR